MEDLPIGLLGAGLAVVAVIIFLVSWKRWRVTKMKVGPFEAEPISEASQSSHQPAGDHVSVNVNKTTIKGSVGDIGVISKGNHSKLSE